jgi:hypothetical protein
MARRKAIADALTTESHSSTRNKSTNSARPRAFRTSPRKSIDGFQ